MVETPVIVERLAQVIGLDRDQVLREGVKHMIRIALREARIEYMALRHKYNVESWAEMEDLYRREELDEENSWEDYFRLMHLEERIGTLEDLLAEIGYVS